MVKRYFRFSIASIFVQLFSLFLIAACIYYSFMGTREIINELTQGTYEVDVLIVTIIFYLGIPLCIYLELTFLIGNICLKINSICICGDIKIGSDKIQYPAEINYVDIEDIEIDYLWSDSRGKAALLSRPVPYLILTNKKGKIFLFGLYLMSRRTVKAMLNDLLKKCIEVDGIQFDIDKLMSRYKFLGEFSIKE